MENWLLFTTALTTPQFIIGVIIFLAGLVFPLWTFDNLVPRGHEGAFGSARSRAARTRRFFVKLLAPLVMRFILPYSPYIHQR
jgi:hypothetical protein